MATTVETFTTPGSFTGLSGWLCPSGVHTVTVRLWGPGGPSGAGQVVAGVGGGGGGGAWITVDIAVTPGTRYDYQIGNGGTAGVAPAGAGIIGTDSWFKSISDALAKAGGPGAGAAGTGGVGGSDTASVGTTKHKGGNGTSGANPGGAGGAAAGSGGDGGNAAGNTGGTSAGGTYPGAAGKTRSAPAIVGDAPGGGASAGSAANTSNGAVGGAGRMELEYQMTETVTDNEGLTDTVTGVVRPYDPTVVFNDVLDIRRSDASGAIAQVHQIWRGKEKIWDWIREAPFTLTMGAPGGYYAFIVPEGCTLLTFDSRGGRGGRGAGYGAPGTVGVSVGGAGSLQVGTLTVAPGDLIEGYVAAKGQPGYANPYCIGGEPGGAAPQENIFGHEYEDLGGCAGGLTSIYRNGVLVLVTAGGGAGGCSSQAGGVGGDGGNGGGPTGQDGHDGTTNGVAANHGFGGKGGTQIAGGLGGVGSTLGNGAGTGQDGGFLAGGSTFRRGSYGTGTNPHPCAGGGGAGYFGGGGGGNGSDPTLVHGAAAGGGGGSDYHDPSMVTITNQVQGGNTGDDGFLSFTFHARRTYTP